jgi:hypothetical protein
MRQAFRRLEEGERISFIIHLGAEWDALLDSLEELA